MRTRSWRAPAAPLARPRRAAPRRAHPSPRGNAPVPADRGRLRDARGVRGRAGVLLALGLLGACDGAGNSLADLADLPPWQSGARVRARLAVADDGFSTRIGWWDRERGLPCTSDDICGAELALADPVAFLDPACSDQALLLPGTVHTGYASLPAPANTLPRLFRVLGGPVRDYFVLDGGGCVPGTGIERLYAVREVPLDELARWLPLADAPRAVDARTTADGAVDVKTVVDGDPIVEGGATRLRTVYLEAAGVRAAVGIHDQQRDVDCTIVETSAGARCVPRTTVTMRLYRDASCQTQVLVAMRPGSQVALTGDVGHGGDDLPHPRRRAVLPARGELRAVHAGNLLHRQRRAARGVRARRAHRRVAAPRARRGRPRAAGRPRRRRPGAISRRASTTAA